MQTRLETLLQCLGEVSTADSADDYFDIATKVVFLFQNQNDTESLFSETDLFKTATIQFSSNLFSNNTFREKLVTILRNHKANSTRFFDEHKSTNVTEDKNFSLKIEFELTQESVDVSLKQEIQTALYLTALPLVLLRKQLSVDSYSKFTKHLNYEISNFIRAQNNEFSRNEISDLINQIVYDSAYHYKKQFLPIFERKLNAELLFKTLAISRNVVGASIIISSQSERVAKSFKKVTKRLEKSSGSYKIDNAVYDIAKPLKIIESNLSEYVRDYTSKEKDDFLKNFTNFSTNIVDKNLRFVLLTMTSAIAENDKTFSEKVEIYIKTVMETRQAIEAHFKCNFSVFKKQKNNDSDWSNKIYIVSIKTLAAIECISEAQDKYWQLLVFINEFSNWIHEVNLIVNKYSLEDDYDEIKRFLTTENENIEWKSSFQMALQQEFVNDTEERKLSKQVLTSVVKPILAMLNTDGGTILVGVVEKPDKIIRKAVLQNIAYRNGICFYDINHEFKVKKEDLDSVKRKIQEQLIEMTGCTADKFNNLIEFKEIDINASNRNLTIVKIAVEKSPKLFYGYDKKTLRHFLVRRADGRTVEVNLAEYLKLDNSL